MKLRATLLSTSVILGLLLSGMAAGPSNADESDGGIAESAAALDAAGILDEAAPDAVTTATGITSDSATLDLDSGTLSTGTTPDLTVALSAPDEIAPTTSDLVADATVSYGDGDSGAVSTTQLTETGGRILITLLSESAPRDYTMPLEVPDGARVVDSDDGGYDIVTETEDGGVMVIAHLGAPWATDANGDPVATSYTIEDGAVIQHIAVGEGQQFPIVADPAMYSCGFFACTYYFTRSQTRAMWSKLEPYQSRTTATIAAAFAVACSPIGPGAVLCAAAGGIGGATIIDNLRYAYAHNQCFTMHWMTFPVVALNGVGHSSDSRYCALS